MRVSEKTLVDDEALRGGHLVLSSAALQEWLSQSLGSPCRVQPRRLRWKPGTSVVLAFDLTRELGGTTVTEACIASAWSDHAAAKMAKARRHLVPGSRLALDAERLVLATTATGDRAVPLLARLGRPGGTDDLIARLGTADGQGRARVRTVRHNPGRRWVGTLEQVGRPRRLLRAYDGPAATKQAAARYRTLGGGPAPTSELLAVSRSWSVLAVTWAEGADLGRFLEREDHWVDAGRALAVLHGSRGDGLPRPPAGRDVDAVAAAAGQVAALLPHLGSDVLEVGHLTVGGLRDLPRTIGPVHGDFSPDQVVVGPDGRPTIIDLDAARLGGAEEDLGCFAASTALSFEHAGDPDGAAQRVRAFTAGYAELRRPPEARTIALHAVAFRLRKAVDPFRECAPDWREQVTARLRAARQALDDVPPASGGRAWA